MQVLINCIYIKSAESRLEIDVFHDLVPKRFSNLQIQGYGAKAFALVRCENLLDADHVGPNGEDLMTLFLFRRIAEGTGQLTQVQFRNVDGAGNLQDALGNVII